MRFAITAFLALLFGVGFAAFFVIDSALGYLSDPDAFVATARDADTRTAVVDAVEADTMSKLAEDPQLGPVQKAGFRALLERTITEAWLEKTLRDSHAAAMAALDKASENAVIDLTPTKQALRQSVADLGKNAEDSCASLFGGTACGDRAASEELIAAFQRNVGDSIGDIPDSVNLVELATGEGKPPPQVEKEMERIRRTVGWARTGRLMALALLGACLLVIALVNASSLSRVLRAVGASVLVGVALYLFVAYGYVRVASREVDDAYERNRDEARDEVTLIALRAGNRAAAAAIRNSAHRATFPVAGIGAAALLCVVGGTLLTRRSR